MKLFNEFALSKPLLDNLQTLHYEVMTPVQEKVIPLALEGQDLIVQAQTGSGKTLSYAIPLLEKTDLTKLKIQSLVIVPTRELAVQVTGVLRQLGRCYANLKVVSLYGGTSVASQIDSLKVGAHIVVGTPGRLLDHLGKGSLDLSFVRTLVLDEADTMLDMGFDEEVQKIIAKLPTQRRTLLFSATYSDKIKKLTQKILPSAKVVTIEKDPIATIETVDYRVDLADKKSALINVLLHHNPDSAIVFVTTKEDAAEVARYLQAKGCDAVDIQGNLEQSERDQRLILFRNGSCRVLVGTDLVARGLDIPKVSMVINYDLPTKEEQYIHRAGRTGRAGESGLVVNLHTGRKKSDISAVPEADMDRGFMKAVFFTLMIYGGRKKKLRAGDIVGSLIKEYSLENNAIGQIEIADTVAYVAITRQNSEKFMKEGLSLKIKGKKFRAKVLKP